MENVNRRDIIARELKELAIGKTRVIAWEPVTRWAADCYEIGTWGKKSDILLGTLDTLCRMRNIGA